MSLLGKKKKLSVSVIFVMGSSAVLVSAVAVCSTSFCAGEENQQFQEVTKYVLDKMELFEGGGRC